MWDRIGNIYRLGVKELYGIRYDYVLLGLIVYSFTYAVYVPAKSSKMELSDASIAIVDEDQSALSRQIISGLQAPFVRLPGKLNVAQIDRAMDKGQYTFVLNIPPNFEADVRRGRSTELQLNVDATAMSQAGAGVRYVTAVIQQEIADFTRGSTDTQPAVQMVARAKFNPNFISMRFTAVVQVINNVTLLAIFLSGAATIREREHGTFEHLLVMPVGPAEIMLAKIWATGLVVVIAATLSLLFVVRWLLEVPIIGSIPLYIVGQVIYLFAVTSLGIFLATVAKSMPQFALLAMALYLVMTLLSGGTTPLDSMPLPLQKIMQLSPTTHFVSFAQAILFRGAGWDAVWREYLMVALIGLVLFVVALTRFRKMVAEAG